MMSFPPTGVQRVSALLHWVSICCCSSVHRDIFSPLNDVSEVLQIQGRVQLSALMSHQPVCRKLQFQPLPADVPVLFRVVELPLEHHLCKVKSLNKGDANSEVTVYYQVKKTKNTPQNCWFPLCPIGGTLKLVQNEQNCKFHDVHPGFDRRAQDNRYNSIFYIFVVSISVKCLSASIGDSATSCFTASSILIWGMKPAAVSW